MRIRGVYTAMITPFRDGAVDYPALEALIEWQIKEGVDGLVPVGTTGESPTLEMEEHIKVIDFVCQKVNGRVQVIAGTGGNATQEAIELTQSAKKSGADATLQVTPYYNKPSQEGIYRHMGEISEKGGLPIILYNVPGRTGAHLELATVERIARNFSTAAIKEAAGSVDRVSALRQVCPELPVLSGDDGLTLPMIVLGATGVISVASNIVPRLMCELVDTALEGQLTASRALHDRLYDLFKHLFIETNPVPVKAAAADMKLIAEEYRLPLCPMSESNRAVLRKTLSALDLI